MTQSATERIRDYYEALRRGEPLYPYFAERPDVVKFGVGERLTGYEAVAEGLREQSRTTDGWRVESESLRVTERRDHAWFADAVHMAWTDTAAERTYDFDTRWSGTLERRRVAAATDAESGDASGVGEGDDAGGVGEGDDAGGVGEGDDASDAGDEWLFVGLHVSVDWEPHPSTAAASETSASGER